jgi:hypothetical protein
MIQREEESIVYDFIPQSSWFMGAQWQTGENYQFQKRKSSTSGYTRR